MSEQQIAVIGAGTMGRGIAQTALSAGFPVVLQDVAEKACEQARDAIEVGLARLVEKGRLTSTAHTQALARLQTTTQLEQAVTIDGAVIEAAPESLALKTELFTELGHQARPTTLLASNTSSISLTRLARAAGAAAPRVVGLHFFNPVPLMRPVEIIRAEQTSDTTVERVEALARDLGKDPVAVADTPGFAVNRLLVPMINEAIFLYQEQGASAADIDQAMKLGAGHPMGPLTLADTIGLDVCLSIMEQLHEGFGDPKYRPCPLLRRMVDAGYLGRKSGRGFHDYQSPEGV
ncbi:MAG: 3-hydroxyacyl-CoA dehydrogenase NAD-binding domain-containing protein [Spiribacter sp.]|jgi:3-hydroxybutyryl-CoA dehydrogenase|nr:3-hydroxyacyl-CoA dehydrogenase NAD-binding domain-containing protein [Spiribacter sp.]MDR9455693.1 3-hydroxyacyl-CoA dehydrogenase NAD-binding domain-containing protein [Spiribacter sp.]